VVANGTLYLRSNSHLMACADSAKAVPNLVKP
jgi:hypothetical protein